SRRLQSAAARGSRRHSAVGRSAGAIPRAAGPASRALARALRLHPVQPCPALSGSALERRVPTLPAGRSPPILVTMRRLSLDPTLDGEADTPPRLCDHPGCIAGGDFRAPKSRLDLHDYYWFCLEHVRAYNSAWNYYAGMSDAEIEAEVRHDTVWQRPSWRLGDRHGPGYVNRIRDYFGVFS